MPIFLTIKEHTFGKKEVLLIKWIDIYVDGVIEYCCSTDIFEIYKAMDIPIQEVREDSYILQGNDGVYIRDFFDNEIVFLKKGLDHQYKKFILAHELAHSILHVELKRASFGKDLLVEGKLERQANYFACRLLSIEVDRYLYEGQTIKQVAGQLGVGVDVIEGIKEELI